MRIAVTYEKGDVFQHFGQTTQFKVYDAELRKVESTSILETNGSGHSELAVLLKLNNVDYLICGGIGPGAMRALEQEGIEFFGGFAGDADQAVREVLADRMAVLPEIVRDSFIRQRHHGGNHHHGRERCHDGEQL